MGRSEFCILLIFHLYSSLIPCTLNSLLVKLFISVLLFFFFFQGFSLALSIESSSSAFSFLLAFSASINLGEIVTYCFHEEVFLCGRVYRMHVPDAFSGRAVFDVALMAHSHRQVSACVFSLFI